MKQSRCVEGLQAGQTSLGVGLFHVACSSEWRGFGIPMTIQGCIVTLGDMSCLYEFKTQDSISAWKPLVWVNGSVFSK